MSTFSECVECGGPPVHPEVYYCRDHVQDRGFISEGWQTPEHMWAHMLYHASSQEAESQILDLAHELTPDDDDPLEAELGHSSWDSRLDDICRMAYELDELLGPPMSRPMFSWLPGLGSKLLSRAQLATMPEPRPLIADTLDLNTTAMLAGHFGSLKSFLALDWGACVATGKPWQGRAVEQGRVLYIAAEGAQGLHKRLAAWEQAWGERIDPGAFVTLPEPVNFGQSPEVSQLLDTVEQLKPSLVIVDTVARCAVGFDENSAKDMGVFVDRLDRLKRACGGTVLAVHHTGKDRRTVRGSSAMEAGVDTIYLSEGDARMVTLERTKRKDGVTHDRLQLKLEVIAGTDSGVIVNTRSSEMAGRSEEVLTALQECFGQTDASGTQLRDVLPDMPKSSFHAALNALVATGLVELVGSGNRRRYKAAVSSSPASSSDDSLTQSSAVQPSPAVSRLAGESSPVVSPPLRGETLDNRDDQDNAA